MSGLLATTQPATPDRLRRARACLQFLGGDTGADWQNPGISIALTRKAWEVEDDFSGASMILCRDGIAIAADARLYDCGALLTALASAGVRPVGATPTELLLAAYLAWGERLVERLNGDYAFVIWDARHRRLLAARDLTGIRPLFFAQHGGDGVSLSSSARALAVLHGRDDALNLATLGAQVAGLPWALGWETVYEDVTALLPGHLLVAEQERVRVERFWHPAPEPDHHPMGAREAETVLRDLIRSAVCDRLGAGKSTVWMSGGWDSTAVFAAGQSTLDPDSRARLRPVSISYPPGDPGREDELIELVASHWGADVRWLESNDIPLFESLEQRAAQADQPPCHLYELWNRELARGTRATGARIALDGCGGDQLFHVSEIVVADLLRSGRWIKALRLARARGHGWRHFARLGVMPLFPPIAFDLLDALLGREVRRHYLERRVAPWMKDGFADDHSLRERDLSLLRGVRSRSLAQAETILYLTLPFWSWGSGYMRGPLLHAGVENRSPLLDRRVVEFALSRPTHERATTVDTKTLLRGAMRDLLPAAVLARRASRTGTTVGFSRRRMREAYPRLVGELFARPLLLAELGIVDPPRLRVGAEQVCAGTSDEFLRVTLFQVMNVEFWLRGRQTGLTRPVSSPEVPRSNSAAKAPRAARASRPHPMMESPCIRNR